MLKGLIHPTEDELLLSDLDDVAGHTEADMKVTGTQLTRVDWKDVPEYDWGHYQPFALSMAAQALAREKYCDVSVSAFVKPLRQVILDQRYDYYETPDKLVDMWGGTTLHAELAKHNSESAEQPLTMDVEGVLFGGTPDNWNPLWDLKDTKVLTVKMCLEDVKANQPEYYNQLLYYRLLLQSNGHKVDEMYLMLRAKDWSETEKERSKHPYPEHRITRIDIEPDPEAEARLHTKMKRYLELKDLPDTALPLCADSYRWPNAAMKSYLNNQDNKATGKQFTRCKYYCPVVERCSEALVCNKETLVITPSADFDWDWQAGYNKCLEFGKDKMDACYTHFGWKGHPKLLDQWLEAHRWLKAEE